MQLGLSAHQSESDPLAQGIGRTHQRRPNLSVAAMPRDRSEQDDALDDVTDTLEFLRDQEARFRRRDGVLRPSGAVKAQSQVVEGYGDPVLVSELSRNGKRLLT